MERAKLNLCKYCSSGNIKKDSFCTNKRGKLQSFKCLECERKFTSNFGFEKICVAPSTIISAMWIYFTGMLVCDTANHYEMMGIKISHMTVYN